MCCLLRVQQFDSFSCYSFCPPPPSKSLAIRSTSDCQVVALDICGKMDNFQPYIPLIQGLRNPGMRMRHWQQLSDSIQINVKPKANLNFSQCLEMGLQHHVEQIAGVAEAAGKEYAIEQVAQLVLEQRPTSVGSNGDEGPSIFFFSALSLSHTTLPA